SIFRSKLLETLHMIALQAAKLLAPPVIRKLRSRRSCEPPRQPIFLATAEHRPDAASRRSLRAYASFGAFQRPLQRLNSLLQGGPLFRGQTSAHFRSGIVLNTGLWNLPEHPSLTCETDREVVIIVERNGKQARPLGRQGEQHHIELLE